MEEIFKDIENYEGIYQVSNFGRVRRWRKKKQEWFYLKDSAHSGGYRRLKLRDSGNDKDAYIHRLVAEAFLDNEGEVVNHIDGDRTNNHVSNLEWCSQLENVSHGKATSGSSKYSGVSFIEKRKKWMCRMNYKGKRFFLGLHNCETSAYFAYLKAMKENNIKNKYA